MFDRKSMVGWGCSKGLVGSGSRFLDDDVSCGPRAKGQGMAPNEKPNLT